MWTAIIGTIGFGCYLLYDINSFRWHNRLFSLGFGAGSLLVAAATCIGLADAVKSGMIHGLPDLIWLLLAILSFAALIYCLFFALPFSDTYTKQESEPKLCDRGVYALCRHPGFIPFFFLYLFLGLAALPGSLLAVGMLFSFWNLLYIWFQDRIIFPRSFREYEDYRQRVPFLIPTPHSIRQAIKTGKKDSA